MSAKIERGWFGPTAVVCFVALSTLAMNEMRIRPHFSSFPEKFEAVVNSLRYPDHAGVSIRGQYTGVASIDHGLQFLVAAFLPGAAGFKDEFQILQVYFLFSFFALISLYSVEAGRRGNKRTLTSYTSLWAIFYQTVGGAVIIPLYYLCFMLQSSSLKNYSPAARQMNPGYAKALAPSLLFGYLLPTTLMYAYKDLYTQQGLIAFWQITPFLVNVLLALFTRWFGPTIAAPSKTGKTNPSDKDALYIKTLYGICLIISMLSHFAMLYCCVVLSTQPQILVKTFIPELAKLNESTGNFLHYMFQVDYLIIFASSLLWAVVAVEDMRRAGKAEVSLVQLLVVVTLGTIVIGPAATTVAIWWWRENKMEAGLKERTS